MNHISALHRTGVSRSVPWAAALAGLALVAQLQAVPLRTSQMVGFSSGNLGTVGTSEGWGGTSGLLVVTNGTGSLDGTGLGLFPSAGDKVELRPSVSEANNINTYNTFATSGQFPQSVRNNLYYSFLYRFNSITNMQLLSPSNIICQVNRQNSGSAAHFNLHAITNASSQVVLGIVRSNGTPVYVTSKPINVGQTFFVVIRQQIWPGSNNDIVDLWLNPAPATFGAPEGSEPPPDATTFDGTEDPSSTGPGRFYIVGGVSAFFDELRIATNSWADVTPPVSSCIPAAFDSHPTNTTVNEGIAARFSVTSSSSSPIYQWQISTNAGVTWNNVTSGIGGTTPNYQTPPLPPSASGHRFRCIATVTCGGGSSATSSVAIVTVNPVTPTPLGVIVDDQFADLDRKNAPVGISNAVWYASAAASLSDGSSGNIVGTPAPGASRLWIAYFTENPAQPVHLAVGRTLKATLYFKASNIVSNGGNSMRFGLFDYADGGGRVLNDGFGTGSTGNGTNVLGYMLVQNWGTNFSQDLPQALLVRNTILPNDLMGSSGNYLQLGSGPDGATLTGAPAFASDTDYQLELSVTRNTFTSVTFTAKLSGGGTNYTTSVTDSTYAYPRFDAFAIRPNSLETTADNFTISRLRVEVVSAAPTPEPLLVSGSGGNVTLTWSNPAFTLQAAPEVTGTYTNVPGASSPYVVPASEARKFFRLFWSP
jgi:hypothetical protein